MDAIRNRDTTKLRTLLNKGVNPDTPDSDGYIALERAAFFCYIEGMRLLINAHADLYIMRNEETLLHTVSKKDCIEGLKLLLHFNFDINRINRSGTTALMYAAYNGHIETVRLLLDSGADLNSANHQGRTPLMMATNRSTEIMEDLLSWGADPNAISSTGKTAFMLSAQDCDVDEMQLLLAYGADPYYINKEK